METNCGCAAAASLIKQSLYLFWRSTLFFLLLRIVLYVSRSVLFVSYSSWAGLVYGDDLRKQSLMSFLCSRTLAHEDFQNLLKQ